MLTDFIPLIIALGIFYVCRGVVLKEDAKCQKEISALTKAQHEISLYEDSIDNFYNQYDKFDYEKSKRRAYLASGDVREADVREYATFLKGFFERGGRPSHFYECPFGRLQMFIAEGDTVVPDGCGTMALFVIAPKGYKVHFEGKQHNHGEIYGENTNPSFVPLYPDVVSVLMSWGVNIPECIYGDSSYYMTHGGGYPRKSYSAKNENQTKIDWNDPLNPSNTLNPFDSSSLYSNRHRGYDNSSSFSSCGNDSSSGNDSSGSSSSDSWSSGSDSCSSDD